MADQPQPTQLLHLVFGGELADLDTVQFRDLEKLDIVGIYPNYVSGDGRFANIVQHAEFNAALDLHCRQAARIVEEFSGGWFSKANFQGGITPRKAAGFVHVAIKKITAELKRAGTA